MQFYKNNPYPHRNNSRVSDYLEEIVLILAKERGLVPISEAENGYQDLEVGHLEAVQLDPPGHTVYASIYVEADPATVNKDCIIRYKYNETVPTATSGQGLGDKQYFEPRGKLILTSLTFIGIEVGMVHTLRIQYYATAQGGSY